MAQSKLATIGEVATGVAHEINQPLTYINTMIQGLQEDLELDDVDEEALRARLAESLRQVDRINVIVRHLRTFGRADDVEMTSVRIDDVVSNTLLLLGERLRNENIAVERQIDDDIPPVLGNSNQLEQVLVNLFQNSVDAFRPDQKDARITVNVGSTGDLASVQIVFSDNGVGIAPSHLEKISEPFFTTKEAGEGTGLGLSIAYGIIMDHKGTIICQSEYTKGTTFTITLPETSDQGE